jgi:hypothetical protein
MSIGGYYSIRDDDDVSDWVSQMERNVTGEIQRTLDNPEWYRIHEGAAELLLHLTRPTVWGREPGMPIDLTYDAGERGLFDLAIERLDAILRDQMEYISSFKDPGRKRAVIQALRDGLSERIKSLREEEKRGRRPRQ